MRGKILMVAFMVASLISALAVLSTRGRSEAQVSTPMLVIYSGENFTGRSLRVTDSLVDLPKVTTADAEFDWNDSVRSLRVVRGTWRLYQHGRWNTRLDDTPPELLEMGAMPPVRGWSCLASATSAGALEVSAPELGGWAEDISSIELVSERNLPDWAAP